MENKIKPNELSKYRKFLDSVNDKTISISVQKATYDAIQSLIEKLKIRWANR